tara:strand:+ start:12 stop:1355 length:1344 start_codon:yes stop_codon:yes gene_type:complete
MLLLAKGFAECHYTPERPLLLKDMGHKVIGGEVIYGDTDSVFVKYKVVDAITDQPVHGTDALHSAVRAGEIMETAAGDQDWMLTPHVLEYEKTFAPFVIVSKKKYVGMKYAAGKTTPSLNSMGIVLKRRDNPPIMKRVYGDVIDGIMKSQDFHSIITRLRKQLHLLLTRGQKEGLADTDDLVISKRYRTGYKNPHVIAHAQLVARMTARDPGNAPRSNDRIPYVFIVNPGAKLQGDRIETPDYIRKNTPSVRVDYAHYVQLISKPVAKLLALRLEDIDTFDEKRWETYLSNLAGKRNKGAITKQEKELKNLSKMLEVANASHQKAQATLSREGAVPPIPPNNIKDRAVLMRTRSNKMARIRRKKSAVDSALVHVNSIQDQIQSLRRNASESLLYGHSTSTAIIPHDKLTTLREKEVIRLIFDVEIKRAKQFLQPTSPLFKFGFRQHK